MIFILPEWPYPGAPKWGGLQPPLIFRKNCVEILKSGLFLCKILKSSPFLIALRRIAKKWTFSLCKNSQKLSFFNRLT